MSSSLEARNAPADFHTQSSGLSCSASATPDHEFVDFLPRGYAAGGYAQPFLGVDVAGLMSPEHPGSEPLTRYLLVRRDGAVVSRASVQVATRHNELWGERDAFCGFFESEDQADAVRLLVETAADWLRTHAVQRAFFAASPSPHY